MELIYKQFVGSLDISVGTTKSCETDNPQRQFFVLKEWKTTGSVMFSEMTDARYNLDYLDSPTVQFRASSMEGRFYCFQG